MISRGYLPKDRPYSTNERYLRLAVSRAQTVDGEWILSTGGKQGGYWLVDDPEKAEHYLLTEVLPRIEEMVKSVVAFSASKVPEEPKEWKQQSLVLEY
jgi:hypothetical protein